jgi:hypothetical protein
MNKTTKEGPLHKKIMEIRDVFVNDDNFDHMREALEAANWQEKISFEKTFQKHIVS